MNLIKQKEKHVLLEPYDVQVNLWYSFTYNPIDQPDQMHHPMLWHIEHNRLFSKMLFSKYHLYPEYSKKGRWHYHGLIRLTDVSLFYLVDLQKLLPYGTLEIDTIKDHEKWFLYCTKLSNEVQPLLYVDYTSKIDNIGYVIHT